MTRLRLTLACGDYDRTRGLWDGSVQPEGIEINYLKTDSGESFWRMLQHAEFDASEMSMSAYIMLLGRGDRQFVGLPAFTSRAFRHNSIVINTAAGIKRPEDLKGRRIGVPQYHMTAALWIRGYLHHDYGVRTEDVEWVQGGLDRAGYPERVELELPASIRLTSRQDRSLSSLLVEGELDAIIGPEWPEPLRARDPRVGLLFPDYREQEKDYYRRTRFFPIMHCIALRRELYEQHRWIAQNLYLALVEAKQRAFTNLNFPGTLKYVLPWLPADYEEATELMGEDYWRYGVEASRHELEAMCQYSYEQGLAPRLVSVEELFAPETMNQFGHRRAP
jgi:4,5-dihydroxyphthalate decarboxylase